LKANNITGIALKLVLFIIAWIISLGVFQISGVFLAQKILPIYNSINLDAQTFDRFFQLIATLFIIFIFTKYVDKTPFISIGLHIKNRISDLLIGFFLGAIIMTIGIFSLMYLQEIQIANNEFMYSNNIALSFIFYLFVAIMEEALCRGYVLGQLLKACDKYLALVISSAFFALLHSFNPSMAAVPIFNLFLAGILLGISYSYTKNLWFPIALHLSWNFFQGPIFGFGVSGFRSYSIVAQTRTEDNFINGGSFGFEGSLLATFLMVISIFCIWRFYERKTS